MPTTARSSSSATAATNATATSARATKDGARIGPPVLNVPGLIRYVRRPAGAMPAFTEKVITDAELTDIYALPADDSQGESGEGYSAAERLLKK